MNAGSYSSMYRDRTNGRRHIRSFPLFALLMMLVVLLPARSFTRVGAPRRAASNAFFEHLAKSSRRGLYPRGFSGEQTYWTLVGVDGGGAHSALISEDGAVELNRGGFSVEPFLIADGRLLTWAGVLSTRALEDGCLPMPGVTWKAAGWTLRIEAFAAGGPADSRLNMNYTVENDTNDARNVTLVLAVRPFQVDPPTQFLNMQGGFSPVYTIDWNGRTVMVNGKPGLFALEVPSEFVATGFKSGDIVAKLSAGKRPQASCASDRLGYASGAMLFHLALAPRGRRAVHLLAPLSGPAKLPEAARQAPDAWTAHERQRVAAQWRAKLNDVVVRLPASAQKIANTLRTSLAYMLISRNGPALRPGTRSYARTWIRDGAMMSEALLRMGKYSVVRDFIDWYAPYQFQSGKAPCCVDARGPDPTPENDSNGEFIFTVAEFYRFTHDRAGLKKLWPHVERAVAYMDHLRALERTPANRAPKRRSFFGLMPASISHEGYWKKPMHSYWDDFWALKGYDDAIYLAHRLRKADEAKRFSASRNQFRKDLVASIRLSAKQHGIDYIPGCAELGDFDPTSTAIALSTGELAYLPRRLLNATFESYWRDFVSRLNVKTDWKDYTPYELRTVDAFTRLGWRNRVQALLDFFMQGRRPAAWNGWAEVVRRDRRKPGFIGDMPHAWIASDFILSVLDMFAYRRSADSAMVLAAGIPAAWLGGEGVAIAGLRTPWGRLDYSLRRVRGLLRLRIDSGAVPPGGFVLPWPYAGPPGETVVNGRRAYWRHGELHMDAAHVEVVVKAPRGEKG